MDRDRYLTLLEQDSAGLLEAAAGRLEVPVPTCPGWTVGAALAHTAEVYEHKMAAIALAGTRPEPWPPAGFATREPLAWFDDARARLLTTLRGVDPAAPSWTWWPPEQTAGFWVRRMAQETAVHRVDVQSAGAGVQPVDAELAADGIDEVLVQMLAGDWSTEPQPGPAVTVCVAGGGRVWRVELAEREVTVAEQDDPAAARVEGAPSDLLLWLWGRAGDGPLALRDRGIAARLRHCLALATQ